MFETAHIGRPGYSGVPGNLADLLHQSLDSDDRAVIAPPLVSLVADAAKTSNSD